MKIKEEPTAEQIIKAVCKEFRVSEQELKSSTRRRYISDLRIIITMILYNKGYTYDQMEPLLNKNRTSFYHYAKVHKELWVSECKEFINKDKKALKAIKKL